MADGKKPTLEEWAAVADEATALWRSQQQQKDLRAINTALQKQLQNAEKRVELLLELGSVVAPQALVRVPGSGGTAVAVAIASDWHVEERVDPKTVNGRNRYNPKIAMARSEKFFQGVLKLVETQRTSASIDTLVLGILGDMITGYIHEEFLESNFMSPTEATVYAQQLLRAGLQLLLDEGGFSKIMVPCCYGNHGRTTAKSRIGTGAANSLEWLMYHQLAAEFSEEPRVEFHIADGYHVILDVLGVKIRFHHGDYVRYGGGVGGLSIPLRKAVDAWNQTKAVDLDVCGHWHQFKDFGDAIVNGSLVGFNAYALSIKARYEPPRQAFFLIDGKRRCKSVVAPIFVED